MPINYTTLQSHVLKQPPIVLGLLVPFPLPLSVYLSPFRPRALLSLLSHKPKREGRTGSVGGEGRGVCVINFPHFFLLVVVIIVVIMSGIFVIIIIFVSLLRGDVCMFLLIFGLFFFINLLLFSLVPFFSSFFPSTFVSLFPSSFLFLPVSCKFHFLVLVILSSSAFSCSSFLLPCRLPIHPL